MLRKANPEFSALLAQQLLQMQRPVVTLCHSCSSSQQQPTAASQQLQQQQAAAAGNDSNDSMQR